MRSAASRALVTSPTCRPSRQTAFASEATVVTASSERLGSSRAGYSSLWKSSTSVTPTTLEASYCFECSTPVRADAFQ